MKSQEYLWSMKSTDIFKAVILGGFEHVKLTISDTDYALPQSSWLTGTFYDFYKAWRKDYGFSEWTPKDDCDNFASLFFCFAQLCHAKSDRTEQGIAVGEFFYYINGDLTKGHAINIAITEKGTIFIDPQTGQLKDLTKAEKASAFFIRF